MEYQSGTVSPTECISAGWNNIKDNYWIFFGITLVAMIILVVLSMIFGGINSLIVYGISLALGIAAQDAGQVGTVSTAIIPQLAGLFIGIFVNTIVITISGVLFCGIYKALSRQSSGEVADFGDLFSEFQKLKPCLIVAVFMSLFQFVLELTGFMVGMTIGLSALSTEILTSDGSLNPALFGGLFLVFIVFFFIYLIITLIFSVLTTFIYPLISERNLSGKEAILTSIKSGLANMGGLLGLLILLGLMAFGGVLLCFIGVFFVVPILVAAIFEAYQSVFGKIENFRQDTPPPPPNFDNQAAY